MANHRVFFIVALIGIVVGAAGYAAIQAVFG